MSGRRTGALHPRRKRELPQALRLSLYYMKIENARMVRDRDSQYEARTRQDHCLVQQKTRLLSLKTTAFCKLQSESEVTV